MKNSETAKCLVREEAHFDMVFPSWSGVLIIWFSYIRIRKELEINDQLQQQDTSAQVSMRSISVSIVIFSNSYKQMPSKSENIQYISQMCSLLPPEQLALIKKKKKIPSRNYQCQINTAAQAVDSDHIFFTIKSFLSHW